jgi:tetratricopeptide (TPR) repeat protein
MSRCGCSPAIATRIGNIHRLWEEWEPALVAYDAALRVAPDHPEGTIGRAISLSHLGRSEEAIGTATRLIEGGQWLLGEAYYWRAWNQLRPNNFQQARTDADRGCWPISLNGGTRSRASSSRSKKPASRGSRESIGYVRYHEST